MSSKPSDLVVIDSGPFIIFCIAVVGYTTKCIVLYSSGRMQIESWGQYLSSAGKLIASSRRSSPPGKDANVGNVKHAR